MNRIYLVRHAESVANAKGVYQGQTYNTGLSPLGYRQAIQLAKHLKNLDLDRVITSPLIRTAYTAHLVSVHHTAPIIVENRLIEIDHGEWEGKSKSEIAKNWPDIHAIWQSYPSQAVFPGGESYPQTQERIISWWQEVSLLPGNTLVVTHDGVIRALLAYLYQDHLDQIWTYDLHPASVTIIENDKIQVLNKVDHLQGMMADLSLHAL